MFVAATSESKESCFPCYIENLAENNEESYIQCSLYTIADDCYCNSSCVNMRLWH